MLGINTTRLAAIFSCSEDPWQLSAQCMGVLQDWGPPAAQRSSDNDLIEIILDIKPDLILANDRKN